MSDSRLKVGAARYPGLELLAMSGALEMFSLLGPDVVEIIVLPKTGDPLV